jgi:hypothetical protein
MGLLRPWGRFARWPTRRWDPTQSYAVSRTEDGARTLATVDRMPIMLPPDLRDDAPEKAWERVLGNTACLRAANVPVWLADAFATGTLNTVGQRSSPTGGGGIGRRSVPMDESTDEKEALHVA